MKNLFTGRRVMVFLIITFLITASILQSQDHYLRNKYAQRGIVSLETSLSTPKNKKIVTLWSRSLVNDAHYRNVPAIEIAKHQTWLDFFFVTLYVLLLLGLIKKHVKPVRKVLRPFGIALAIIAGSMDVIEDIFMLVSMHSGGNVPAFLIGIPAIIKFISLLLVIGGLLVIMSRDISKQITASLRFIWHFRIVMIGLIFMWLILWMMDQGQDLLLTINSYWLGPVLTLVIVSILALLNWYLPKYYDMSQPHSITLRNIFFGTWEYEHLTREKTFTGRLLGAATFLVPSICILHAMQVFAIHFWLQQINPIVIFVCILIFYRLVLEEQWFCSKVALIITSVLSAAIIGALAFFPSSRSPSFLAWFAFDFFLLSFAFLVFANVRKNLATIRVLNRPITPYILFAGLAVALVFIYANLLPLQFALSSTSRYFTLPIVFTADIFYVFLFSMILLCGKKLNVQLLSFCLIFFLGLAVVTNNNFHKIRLISKKQAKDAGLFSIQYAPFETYAENWLQHRATEIADYNLNAKKPFPVFIVNAYGGGVRAAAWTSEAINAIDKGLQPHPGVESRTYDFQHFIFAYSGASGGTVGSSVLCAERYASLTGSARPDTNNFYKNDFLTPVIITMLGRDVFLSAIGARWFSDRGRVQEKIWEKQSGNRFDYSLPLKKYWYDERSLYEVPLLFANTYDLDSGLKGITAPVKLKAKDFPATVFINDLVGDSQLIRLSTASFLSARFPYISPEAKIDNSHHFLDGGLKENSGAETAQQVLQVLQRVYRKLRTDSLIDSVRFNLISLPNSFPATDSIEISKNVFELTAPLTALMNNWVGNTTKSALVNQALSDSGRNYGYYSLRPQKRGRDVLLPILPLGWQLSDSALAEMEQSIFNPINQAQIESIAAKIKR